MIELPKLDDRTFADFVAAARASIPSLAPKWTDHNASDPGIALVELLAWLSEIVMYRLDRVPDRSYRTFLQLLSGQAPDPKDDLDDVIRKTLEDLRERHRAVTTDDYEYLALQRWSTSAAALAMGIMGPVRRARAIGEHSVATLASAWKDPRPKAGESHMTVVVVADAIAGSKAVPAFALERRYALDLDGASAYVDCGNDQSLRITDALTVSAWIFPRNLSRGRQGIVSKQAAGELELYVEPDGTIGFHHADGLDGGVTTAKVAIGQWAHVAAVRSFDGKSLLLYIDGALAGSASLAKKPSATNAPLVIGRLSSSTGYFDGLIRDVSVWNVARGALEIAIDMRRVPLGADDTRLVQPKPALPVACWRLDQIATHRDPTNDTTPLVTPDAETLSTAKTRPRDGVVSPAVRWQDVMRPLATSETVLKGLRDLYATARLLTTRVEVIDHRPLPVVVTAEIYLRSDGVKTDVQRAAKAAIDRVLDPLRGWDGKGWPFDRPIYNSDLGAALDKLPGVDFVDGVKIELLEPDRSAEANKNRKPNPRDEKGAVIGVSLQPNELPYLTATTLNLYHRVGARWQLV